MQNFNNLEAYKKANNLVMLVYGITNTFPKEETFSLTAQMRRAALSIGANIAEGTGRRTDADFLRFLHNAMGSLKELNHYLTISKNLAYLDDATYGLIYENVDKVGRKLNNLIKSIHNV